MKTKLLLVAALSLLSLPALANNWQYCIGSGAYHTCEYLWDTPLSDGTTYWSYDTGSGTSYVSSPCAGGAYTDAADLDPGDAMFQAVDTDEWPVWRIEFDLYKTSTSVGSNDYFIVQVYNYNTFQTETINVYASSYSGLCGSVGFNLSNDYDNATVRVLIKKNSSATATMYVDNVTLWGRLN